MSIGKPVSSLLANLPHTTLTQEDVCVGGLEYSSRSVKDGDLFFCIPGTRVDGHDFAADAVSRGAAALVVQRPLELDIPQYIVQDSREALALASAAFFDHPSQQLALMGITGTNGKTTTSFLLEWICRYAGLSTGLLGTVEWRVADQVLPAAHTTPESFDLQSMLGTMRDKGVQAVAMEVSSHAIDLHRIDGCSFKVLGFTNLTQDHLDYHHDMETYAAVKTRLFTDYPCGSYAISIDDELGARIARMLQDRGANVITVGICDDAYIHPLLMGFAPRHIQLELSIGAQKRVFRLPLVGRFNIQNAMLALAMALQAGIDLDSAIDALRNAPQVPGRLERVHCAKELGFSVFVDYAHTPDAVSKASRVLKDITPGRLITVFGCGGDRDRTKRPLMGTAALEGDFAIVTSDNPRTEDPLAIIADILPGMQGADDRMLVQPDRHLAIREAIHMAKPGDTVLLAGKGHEDYQIIGTVKHPFDDRVVAAQEMDAL